MAETGLPTVEVAFDRVTQTDITLSVHETHIEWGRDTSDADQITLVCDPVSGDQQQRFAGVPHVWLKLHILPNKSGAWRAWAWSGFCTSHFDDEGRTVVAFAKERPGD